MKNMTRLISEDSGQGLTEYALIVALISVALVAGLIAFRAQIQAVFTAASTALASR